MNHDETEWLGGFDHDIERKYGLDKKRKEQIKRIFTGRIAWHTVCAITDELMRQGRSHDEIARLAGVDRSVLYKWQNGKVVPKYPAIDLLVKRTGLNATEMMGRPPLAEQNRDALVKTVEHVKRTIVMGPRVPDRMSEVWLSCMKYVLERVQVRMAGAIADADFARIVVNDAKGELPRFGMTSISEINKCLNNWFDAYHLAVAVIGDLLERR